MLLMTRESREEGTDTDTDTCTDVGENGGGGVRVVHVDEVEPTEVAPGIIRRRLPGTAWARGWMYDFAPGTEWPEVDVHGTEERYYVVSGEFIDCGRRLAAGSYVVFAPGSTHRPRTETGARMIGITIRG